MKTEAVMFSHRVDDEIELGLLEKRHSAELFALVDQNRAHLREWLPWVDQSQTVEDTEKFIQSSLERFAKNGDFVAGIWYCGQLVGLIDFHAMNSINRRASIGYWLAKSHAGKGIMTRACRAMLTYGFDELKLNRIEIRVATENKKSRAIPERLGFKEEGILREVELLYDHFVDHVVYSLLAREWKS